MSYLKIRFFSVLLLTGLPVWALAADELNCGRFFDGRRLSFVVPYQAGAGYDTYSRAFATVMEEQTGARVQVRNLTGAGGMTGIQAIADARPESLTLGIINPVSIIDSQQIGLNLPALDQFLMLGSFIMDTSIGVTLKGTNLLNSDDEIKVVGVTGTEMVRTLLVARSLSWEARLVSGYSGSSERWLALLRGDIDVSFGTTESLTNYIRSSPEAMVFLSLTDSPNELYPEIPYLAGEGGLVDLVTQDIPATERQSRMYLAQLAADLHIKPRAIAVTSRISQESSECLINTVEQVLFSEQLFNILQRQGLGLQPATSTHTEDVANRLMDLVVENKALLEAIIAELEDN